MFKGLFKERRRAMAVHRLADPDTTAEPALDRVVDAAAAAFVAPIAAISLIHDDQQRIKAHRGLAIGAIARGTGFCRFALDRTSTFECCDSWADPGFATLPSVIGRPHIRYYMGAPLRLLNGIDVGALCVIDTVPRPPASADQVACLLALARQASRVLEAGSDIWSDAA